MYVATMGLVAVNLLWGLALVVDPRMGAHPRVPYPPFLSILHIGAGIALLIRGSRLPASIVTFVLSAYYSLYVKPFAPLAEPQTVGIASIALYTVLRSFGWMHGKVLSVPLSNNLVDILLRGGLTYPFLEWGLDAYRNPRHFVSYINSNHLASTIVSPIGAELATFLLFLCEISLAALLLSGALRKLVGLATSTVLIFFSLVAGYPLAIPQNLALIAASLHYATLDRTK